MLTVKMLDTGNTECVNDSYALRLYEQGKAVIVKPAPKKPAKAAPAEPKKSDTAETAEA